MTKFPSSWRKSGWSRVGISVPDACDGLSASVRCVSHGLQSWSWSRLPPKNLSGPGGRISSVSPAARGRPRDARLAKRRVGIINACHCARARVCGQQNFLTLCHPKPDHSNFRGVRRERVSRMPFAKQIAWEAAYPQLLSGSPDPSPPPVRPPARTAEPAGTRCCRAALLQGRRPPALRVPVACPRVTTQGQGQPGHVQCVAGVQQQAQLESTRCVVPGPLSQPSYRPPSRLEWSLDPGRPHR